MLRPYHLAAFSALFVALAPHMQMNMQEPITRLCPVDVCGDSDNALGQSSLVSLLADSTLILLHRSLSPSLRQQLPPIDESWAGFVETESGHKHFAAGDPRFAFLEQVQQAQNPSFNTDHWLGQLIDAIQARGLWEQALVIVTADHGPSFKAGMARHWVEDGNMADIMSVPLFIKLPGQENSSVNYGNAQSIDIVATIADVLKLKTWWSLDGISLTQAENLAARTQKHFQYKRPSPNGGFTSAKLSPAILNDPTSSVQQPLASAGRANMTAHIDKLQALSNYDTDRNNKLPAHLRIDLEREFEGLIGIELNGVIRATSRTFSYDHKRLAVILEEGFFQPQHNKLALYARMDNRWYEIDLE